MGGIASMPNKTQSEYDRTSNAPNKICQDLSSPISRSRYMVLSLRLVFAFMGGMLFAS